MGTRMVLPVLAVLAFAAAARTAPKPDNPQECPLEDVSHDAVEAALNTAPSCEQAAALFGPCAMGSSGDVSLGEAVIKKCEGEFLGKLTAGQKRAYSQAIKACWQKYQRKSGTMYRSQEAMCAAAVAQNYAKRFSKATPGKK